MWTVDTFFLFLNVHGIIRLGLNNKCRTLPLYSLVIHCTDHPHRLSFPSSPHSYVTKDQVIAGMCDIHQGLMTFECSGCYNYRHLLLNHWPQTSEW